MQTTFFLALLLSMVAKVPTVQDPSTQPTPPQGKELDKPKPGASDTHTPNEPGPREGPSEADPGAPPEPEPAPADGSAAKLVLSVFLVALALTALAGLGVVVLRRLQRRRQQVQQAPPPAATIDLERGATKVATPAPTHPPAPYMSVSSTSISSFAAVPSTPTSNGKDAAMGTYGRQYRKA
jgi:hypothetical protein